MFMFCRLTVPQCPQKKTPAGTCLEHDFLEHTASAAPTTDDTDELDDSMGAV